MTKLFETPRRRGIELLLGNRFSMRDPVKMSPAHVFIFNSVKHFLTSGNVQWGSIGVSYFYDLLEILF